MEIIELILRYWLIVYIISTALSLTWYLAICYWSHRWPSWLILLAVFTVLPFYVLLPINLLAICAGLKHRKDTGIFKGYRYYNVRLLFRQETADRIYGEHDIVPLRYFQKSIDEMLKRSENKSGPLYRTFNWFNRAHKKIRSKLHDAMHTILPFL
ncbi:hypothetical protein COT97_03295 [Candidatus Falkowbacteria bacterium CG10_big_fil_rev_8_21_14_0_10_39_11]|uniref:Uncharacterized protein n=1 Tax=Candidatus Falkowbacteria bacterium CG10_big_fil_rev_8_21_14_0_10_39_11 TaxID=1974565 RepID=A0A2H0V4W2_9BACT|nr:MAG: hypothetical protein COT97_03295 [Candidatus Falkowbacteria bacterium CG10_big_fil_rev_8_21_14_0_10_39_11]